MMHVTDLRTGARHTANSNRCTERRYYTAVAGLFLVVMVWGFARSFFLRPLFSTSHFLDLSGTGPIPLLVILHGVATTAWFLLFFVQTSLVATRRLGAHRQLGVVAAIVGALLVALTAPVIVFAIPRMDRAHHGRDLTEVLVYGDSLALLWFTGFIGTAICLRRRTDVHKRLMVLGSIAILYPALARIGDMMWGYAQTAITSGTFVLWCSLALHDRVSRRRLHFATVWGGLLLIVVNPLLMTALHALNDRVGFVDVLGRLAYALGG